jgi:hypothetical protein
MTPRERILATVLLAGVLVAGGGFLYSQLYLAEMDNRRATIEFLRKENREKDDRIALVRKQKAVYDRAKQLSLPPEIDLGRLEYERYLRGVLEKSGFVAGDLRITPEPADFNSSPKVPGKKEPIYVSLPFAVNAHGTLDSFVDALERFYQTPLLHRIKGLVIQKPLTQATPTGQQRQGDLDFTFTVEALVLNGVNPRSYLLPNIERWMIAADALAAPRGAPAGLALALWAVGPTGLMGPRSLDGSPLLAPRQRDYAAIAGKNIFYGPDANLARDERRKVEPTKFVHLMSIYQDVDTGRWEAWLRDRYNNQNTRLRCSPGFDSFRIKGEDGETVLRGKVVRMEQQDLVIQVDDKHYRFHIGQSLDEALRKPLNSSQMKELGLAVATTGKNAPGGE